VDRKIELTPEELEELKDDIKFREKVMLQLKQLNGIPQKVIRLETEMKIYAWLIGIITIGILGLAVRVLAR